MDLFKKILGIFLRIVISALLLAFLFNQVDKKSLFELIKNSDKWLLFSAFLVFFIGYPLGLFRWMLLLKTAKIDLPFWRVVGSFLGGVFFSLFLPSTIGGDLVRSVDLSAYTKKPKEVVATVLLDRLSGYIGLVLVSLVAVILGWKYVQDKTVLFVECVITGILIFVLLVLFNSAIYAKINKLLSSPTAGKIREAIKNLQEEIHYFKHHRKMIVNNLILSVIIQIIAPLTFFLVGLSLGIRIDIIYFFVFIPIIGAITLLPISIGGLGLRELTAVSLFAKAGVSKDLAFAMSLLNFSFILIYGSIGGLIYVLTIRNRRLQHNQSPGVHPHP